MIVDHRTYTLRPGTIKDYVVLYERKGFPVQTRHLGMPLGWYVSMDIGPLNQIVHLWAYEDLADRARRREALQADPDWQAFIAEASKMILHMENKILHPAPFMNR
ncbi:MAG TPA: NIPSNAP family protein [Rhodospirillales bacterium]|nr:NIPSNAP family protein [Rhodospirillales bacterium]